ncbi:MAG TPA: MerR family transcriptional regulator [Caulobacteraceae bacterium]|nr:MerR family transcriptional regulator [Caulobacteraceae bacterium]
MAKGPEAFRTISEASEELGVPQHVLRFWESKFSFIRPMKRAGGRRFYRPQDLVVLRGVQVLLHDEGYTIKGVQKLHREQGVRRLVAAANGDVEAVYDEPEGEIDTDVAAALEVDAPTEAQPAPTPPPAVAAAPPLVPYADGLAAIAEDLVRAKADLDRLLAPR